MTKETKPLVIYGTGDMAMLVYEVATMAGKKIAGFTSDGESTLDNALLAFVPRTELLQVFPPESYDMFMGFIGKGLQGLRSERFYEMMQLGYQMPNIVQPGAHIAGELGQGNLVMAGAVVGPRCRIGNGNILWQNCVLAHDNIIGDFNNIAPTASLSGYAKVGSHAFVGNGAVLNNFVYINDWVLVGAGSYANKDVPENAVLVPERSCLLKGKKGIDFA